MHQTHAELLQRRERLLLRSGELRQAWSQQVQWLVHHPEWPLGVVLLLVVMRPGRALRWTGFAFQGYTLYRRVQRVLASGPSTRL